MRDSSCGIDLIARKLTHADENERRLRLVVNRAQRLRQIEPPHEAIRFVDEDRARMIAQHRKDGAKIIFGVPRARRTQRFRNIRLHRSRSPLILRFDPDGILDEADVTRRGGFAQSDLAPYHRDIAG